MKDNLISEQGSIQPAFIGALVAAVNESSNGGALTIDSAGEVEKPEFFYENEGSVFGLSQEVVEFEEGLFVKIYEIEDSIYESLDEKDIVPTGSISIDDVEYKLGDEILTTEDKKEFFVKLIAEGDEDEADEEEGDEDESEEDEADTIEIDGQEYEVIEEEDESDGFLFYITDEDDEIQIVEDEEGAEGKIFLKKIAKNA